MPKKILITGGAGFIGSHLADKLLQDGHDIAVLDCLHPQIHGPNPKRPAYLHKDVDLVIGDIRDEHMVGAAVQGKDIIFHFASHTGVGQSMYEIKEYMDVNVQGTAVLLEAIQKHNSSLQKLILASSRAVYGEGAYHCHTCGVVSPKPRSLLQLQASKWELNCPNCNLSLTPIPTPETYPTDPRSVYAVSKLTQEHLCTIYGETYKLPVVVLRYFNVYGPRQSLSNPYTGVLSTFMTRLYNNKPLNIYEDGQESRDFIHVSDIVQACHLAMKTNKANDQIFNIATGKSITLMEIAQTVTQQFRGPSPKTTGQYRFGDIRHSVADITKAKQLLGYFPRVSFADGVVELIEQAEFIPNEDLSSIAEKELQIRGLSKPD